MIKDYEKSIIEILQNKSLQIKKDNFKYYSFFNWYEATSFIAVGDSKSKYSQYYLFITNAPIIIDEAFFLPPAKIKFPFLLNFGAPPPRSTLVSYYPILTRENFKNKNKAVGVIDNKTKDNTLSYELARGLAKGFFGMPVKEVKGYNGCLLEYSTNISFAKMADIFAKTKPCEIDLRFSDYANVSRIVNYFSKTGKIDQIVKELKTLLVLKYPESTVYQEQLAWFYEQAGAKKLALKNYQELINKLNLKIKQAKKNKRKNKFFNNEFIKLCEEDLKRVKSKIASSKKK